MNKRKTCITVSAIVLAALTAVCVFLLCGRASREIIHYQDMKNRAESIRISESFNSRLQAIEDTVDKNARAMGEMPTLTLDYVRTYLKQSLAEYNKEQQVVFAMAVAFHQDTMSGLADPVMIYAHYKEGKIITSTYGDSFYHYPYHPWYCVPQYLGKTIWTEPYFDYDAGNILMTTCAAPFYREINGKKQFAGVVTADLAVTQMQRMLNSHKDHKFKFIFLISQFGKLLSHPDISKVMAETIYSIAFERNATALSDQFRADIEADKPGVFTTAQPMLGIRKAELYYVPLDSNDWTLGMIFDHKHYQQQTRGIRILIIIAGVVVYALLLTAVVIFSRRLQRITQ